MQTKLKLSEIIKTDCYIDCGTNEKLREVYPLIDMMQDRVQELLGIPEIDKLIFLIYSKGFKGSGHRKMPSIDLPTHHISEIDLTA